MREFGLTVNSGRVYSGVPTYAYRCEAGHQFETVQGITDPALTKCTICGAPVRRVVFPVGIVFKGQGFYKNDSRASSSSAIAPAATTASETKDENKSTAAPAKSETGASETKSAKPKKGSASESAAPAGHGA